MTAYPGAHDAGAVARSPHLVTPLCEDPPVREDPRPRSVASPLELARDRNTTRRDRNRHNLVPGVNGKPYAMLRANDGSLLDVLRHGDESTYANRHCRCEPCGDANSAAQARRRQGVPAPRRGER